MREYDLLSLQLKNFWDWANISFKDYIANIGNGEWESNYLSWNEIYESVENIIAFINANSIDHDYFSIILEAMAIDSESEVVKLICVEKLNKLTDLIEYGYKHKSAQVRWQICDIISEKTIIEKQDVLKEMVKVEHDKYVLRKILLALYQINQDEAEKIAFQKLTDEDEYVRLVSIRILKDCKSLKLSNAYELLKDDSSELVKNEVHTTV